MTELEKARLIAKTLDKKLATDIEVLHITECTIVADYFVIASGTSETHVRALADEVEFELEKAGEKPLHIEGKATGWILLDFGDTVVHVFTRDKREFYGLERLWSDAESIDISDLIERR